MQALFVCVYNPRTRLDSESPKRIFSPPKHVCERIHWHGTPRPAQSDALVHVNTGSGRGDTEEMVVDSALWSRWIPSVPTDGTDSFTLRNARVPGCVTRGASEG